MNASCIQYSMQKMKAVIHLKSICDNAKQFRSKARRLCAVVKANAYGHGAEEVTYALQGIVDCFAVALIEEAIAIRAAACGKGILVFTPPLTEEDAEAIIKNGFIGTISDLRSARLLMETAARLGKSVKAHIKVNTGMNRYGIMPIWVGRICAYLQEQQHVLITGIYSHLYTTDREIANVQRKRFCRAIRICKTYYPDVIAHLGGTYAAMLGEKFCFDMVRVGIGLYGYLPTENAGNDSLFDLKKGMTVYAVTTAQRKYHYGGCGYGIVGDCPQGVSLSVDRFGYADGFLRRKENGVIGAETHANNLCMDACIRRANNKVGQWRMILSDADCIARQTGTISYEVLCAATRRAELIYEYD